MVSFYLWKEIHKSRVDLKKFDENLSIIFNKIIYKNPVTSSIN